MGGSTASGAASEDARLLGNRYVDQKGKPLGIGAAPPYAEFKMMPVKLGVIVNQGRISDLLVNCVNCTMPIEVRRVNLWSKGGGASSLNVRGGATGMGGMGMGGMGMGGMGMGGMGMGGMGMESEDAMGMDQYGGGMGMDQFGSGMVGGGGPTGTRREQITLVTQKDIPIEIEGIIYIFNKPVEHMMGTGTEEGATPPASLDTESSTAPAAPTPPETTPETAAPAADTQPPGGAPESAPVSPTTPPVNATPPPAPAAGAGEPQPATTQPTAAEEPVTP